MSPASIPDNHAAFRRLVRRAELALARGSSESAAVSAQVAATFAWFNHPGVFASAGLERLLHRIGHALPTVGRAPERLAAVHVATQVYPTGGHTQSLLKWLEHDPASPVAVVVTGQGAVPLPPGLESALAGRGHLHLLDRHHDRLTDRALALRALAATDRVFLHIHPNDVVAPLAFPTPHLGDLRVFFIDHADHVFWIGTEVADYVLNLRSSGAELCRTRRGIHQDRHRLLLRPLDTRPRSLSREEAKRRLGIPESTLTLVTAAAGTKYEPIDGIGFLDLVAPALVGAGMQLLAAGPSPAGAWQALAEQGSGRALGLLPDVHELLCAADVYIDSYPFSSLTSMLEAGSLGVPVITLRPDGPEPSVLGADTPELDPVLLTAGSVRELVDVLASLAEPAARARLGEQTAAGIAAAHADGVWLRSLHESTGPGPRHLPPGHWVEADPEQGTLDRRLALVQQQTGLGQGELGAALLNAPLLPPLERVRLLGSGAGVRAFASAQRLRQLRAAREYLRNR